MGAAHVVAIPADFSNHPSLWVDVSRANAADLF
jgi:hypothetical protein